jgi:hypothetical protein
MTEPHTPTAETPETGSWLRLIRAEYLEVPGLCLTRPQVERLWNLDTVTAGTVIEALTDVQFLRRTRRGTYVLASLA